MDLEYEEIEYVMKLDKAREAVRRKVFILSTFREGEVVTACSKNILALG
jgi:hypothetical protein